MLVLSVLLHLVAVGCEVTLGGCDQTWSSQQNQTFAYFEVAPGAVQLRAYWGNDYGCVAKEANDTVMQLSQQACTLKSSVWLYGPGSIADYVYYTNNEQQSLCLTGLKVQSLTLSPCCHLTNCTKPETEAQMWYEHPVSTDPYNRIETNTSLCLTRCTS